MPYVPRKDPPCANCERLAELALLKGGDYYENAERLAEHYQLRSREKLQLHSNLQRMLEGQYLEVAE